jgi:dGTPase
LVSKIARTIGRLLRLNEDLIEAMALGHDIGHPPFGHDGERFLSEKCQEHGIGPFLHNVQSVRFLQEVEKEGRGLNLTLQVLDGVLCHDGEVHSVRLSPQTGKDFAELDRQIAAKQEDPKFGLIPMTMEGCVVRIADTVSYVGRDLEDAILLGLIQREDLPAPVSRVLGDTNGTIVYRLVEDLIQNSLGRDSIAFSEEVGQALGELKEFNLNRIYLNPKIKSEHSKIRQAFHSLFDSFLADLKSNREQSPIYEDFLSYMDPAYRENHRPAEIVRDFIASMTDENLLQNYRKLVWPSQLGSRLD